MNAPEHNPLRHPLRAVAALLAYPDADVQQHAAAIGEPLVTRPELTAEDRRAIETFLDWYAGEPLLVIQAAYVETFDHSKKVSLYLFEHVYGESRDRGPAMVELRGAYRERGLVMTGPELPDYLPTFLEFCAELPEAEARGWLDEIGEIIQPVHVRLVGRGSDYAAPLRVLARLIGVEPMPEALVDEAAGEPRDDTRAALDRVWAEAPVTFGPDRPGTDCGATKQWQEQPVQWRTAAKGRSI